MAEPLKKLHQIDKNNLSIDRHLNEFSYQIDLTKKLDEIPSDTPFTQEILNEIVLWKVNRYAPFTEDALEAINAASNFNEINESNNEAVKQILKALLKTHGVSLPMASTILRFRNPKVFQIIDQRAYRILMPEFDRLPIYSATSPEKQVETYLQYLKSLRDACDRNKIPFELADRYLYQLDIHHNSHMPIH